MSDKTELQDNIFAKLGLSSAKGAKLQRLVMFLRGLFHVHKYKTLLIYPPHNQKCKQPQCENSAEYGFLMQCDCGYTKTTKLPYTITEVFEVRSKI